MRHLERIAFATALLVVADPALAGRIVETPAPIAGAGIGAIALIGFGYRALKSRIKP